MSVARFTVPYGGGTITGEDAVRSAIDDLDARKDRQQRARERWEDGSARHRLEGAGAR